MGESDKKLSDSIILIGGKDDRSGRMQKSTRLLSANGCFCYSFFSISSAASVPSRIQNNGVTVSTEMPACTVSA